MAGEKGLFGVRGFGLYERWTSWVGTADDDDAEEEFQHGARGFSAGFGAFGPPGSAVVVLARCRPLLRSGDASCQLAADVVDEGARLRFQAPQVGLHEVCCTAYLGPESTQETVFEHAARIVERTVDGCNGLVLCCGTSRSGKTYTMAGPPENVRSGDSQPSEGIIPRAARLIFERMKCMEDVFVVEASFLDVHPSGTGAPEQLTDLLTEKASRPLRVLQDALRPGAFVCEGLSRMPVRRYEKVSELVKAGLKRREALEAGSRSRPRKAHCIFTISLESLSVAEGAVEPTVKRGKLVFVEFAGLPSPGLAHGNAGPSAQRSLALEMLLADCVRGDAPVLLVANFSPELQCAEQSVRTLALAESVLLGQQMADEHAEPFLQEAEPPPADLPPQPAAPPLVSRAAAAAVAPPSQPSAKPVQALGRRLSDPAAASSSEQRAPATAGAAAGRPPFASRLGKREEPPRESPSPPQPPPPEPEVHREAVPREPESPQSPKVVHSEVSLSPPQAASPAALSGVLKHRSGLGAARAAELEDTLRETQAMRRAVEMEVAQLKAKVASTEERVRLLGELSEEFSRDRNSHHEEHRTLRTKADMQQQKLMMHEEELQKLRTEVAEKKAEVTSLSATSEMEVATQGQERERWKAAEVDLQQKVGKLRRELEDFRRKASVERIRFEKAGDEACIELRLRIQQLQEKATADNEKLEQAQRIQATMETERRVQEQREEALRENGMRDLTQLKRELAAARQRENELQHMLTELQDGLLSAEEAAATESGGHPMTIAGA